jgi:hypothetical protein
MASCKLQTNVTVHYIPILFSTFIRYDLNIFTVLGTSCTQYLCKDFKQCCHLCSFTTAISHTLSTKDSHNIDSCHSVSSSSDHYTYSSLSMTDVHSTDCTSSYPINISQNNSYALPYINTMLICVSSGITEN